MKKIEYQYCVDVNYGTDESPNIVPQFYTKTLLSPDEVFEANLTLAKSEAYNGEVTVEEVEEETGIPKTIEQRVETLEDSNAEMTEALDLLLSGVTE